jgi:hypothetical protein
MPSELEIGIARVHPAQDGSDDRIVTFQVTNSTGNRLHVWATPRAITYDADSKTDIDIISTHPRLPAEAVLEPGESAPLRLRLPPTLHTVDLGASSGGLGLAVADVPVADIDRVNFEIAVSDTSLSDIGDQPPEAIIHQLRTQPSIVTGTVDATSQESGETS